MRFLHPTCAILLTSLLLAGCTTPLLATRNHGLDVSQAKLSGHVSFDSPRLVQATMEEVGKEATVSLIDAGTGNTVSSSVTDASGSFVLTFKDFTPVMGNPYTLEAVKGLSVGGSPNRAGASAARVRTLLFWNDGWQSLTNTTQGVGIMVGASTTALSTVVSLKKQAGVVLDLTQLIGKVNETNDTFADTGTGLSSVNDFQPVLSLVANAILLDQDPLGTIALDSTKGTYSLATGVPLVQSISPAVPVPGNDLTIKGSGFDTLDGRNAFWFGAIPASTWSVSTDKTTVTVPVPTSAYSAPFTLQQPGGVTQTLHPFLKLKGTVGTLAGSGYASYADGKGIDAQFKNPVGMAIDSNGILYVAEQKNQRIRKITPDGTVTTLAGSGTAGSADGIGTAAQFSSPSGLALDANGNLYVGDAGNNKIRKVSPDGTVSTFAGSGTAGSVDGTGTAAQFYSPYGVSSDGSGNLYVGDYSNHKIRIIVLATGEVSTVAGSGTAGSADGFGTSAQFTNPIGTIADGNGNLYVAEYGGHRIRKIVLSTGEVSTVAGNGTAGFSDGTGTSAQFDRPYHLVMDGNGDVMVGDNYNYRIRRVTPAGVVTTLAGGISGVLDGSLIDARFGTTPGLARDTSGNFYVADSTNHRIRVISP